MTATIERPDSDDARRRRYRQRNARFSSMESLGFIETPTSVSDTRWTSTPPAPAPPANGQFQRGAHERTVLDWEPTDATREFLGRRVRWGLLATVTLLLAGLTLTGAWLWQRPAAIAEAARADVTTAAGALRPELLTLRDLTQTLTAESVDNSALSAQSFVVDARARELFDASGELGSAASSQRARAAEAATAAVDASRLLTDAAAYRSAVTPILVAPDLETDPEVITLDDAIRGFGEWQQRFNDVRSVLPDNTMSDVSDRLELISGNLESIQRDYVDRLRNDDRVAARQALDDLARRLSEAEAVLHTSLAEIQERIGVLIDQSLSDIDELVS